MASYSYALFKTGLALVSIGISYCLILKREYTKIKLI